MNIGEKKSILSYSAAKNVGDNVIENTVGLHFIVLTAVVN
jgi:hypothetical protein